MRAKKRKRIPSPNETKPRAFRLPDDLVVRLNSHLARMKADRPGEDVSMTDAVRALLTAALNAAEREPRVRK
jgi:hypothetical protein